jgi:16S rRNA (guanine966-N2)-methyltransferase
MSKRGPGRVRIVAGTKRGRLLRVPPGGATRPTTEMVRAASCDVLGPVTGLSVLDLFAGTGAMGLEALSRGARDCVFVEEDPVVAAVLRENIASLQYEAESRVINAGHERALRTLAQSGPRFDLLFLDPPYRMLSEVEASVAPLVPSLLSVDGVAVVEGDRATQVSLGQEPLFDRTYGDTRVVMIRMRRSTR